MEIQGPGPVQGPRRIDDRKVTPARATDATSSSAAAKGDAVEISQRARDVAAARALLGQVPEARMDRVRELRAAIERGDYETPEKFEVAVDRLLRDLRGEYAG